MFIELTEFLRCPQEHEDAFCVVLPDEMVGRMIVRGVIGCPACRREYPIRDGIAEFGAASAPPGPPVGPGGTVPDLDPDVAAALLGVTNPGGYVVLVGSAAALAPELAARLAGLHFVGMNPPPSLEPSPVLTLLRHETKIPLRSAMARGVMVPAEWADAAWLSEAARVLLKGLRLVAAGQDLGVPGLTPVASGRGWWVGQKT